MSSIEVEEKDFSILKRGVAKVSDILGFSARNNKVSLFIIVNILLYGLAVGLGILKLFGII